MQPLDECSPYLAKRNRALKNLLRARRACNTLSGEYAAGRGTWQRYSESLDVCFSVRETLNMLDAQHSAWILDQLAYR